MIAKDVGDGVLPCGIQGRAERHGSAVGCPEGTDSSVGCAEGNGSAVGCTEGTLEHMANNLNSQTESWNYPIGYGSGSL